MTIHIKKKLNSIFFRDSQNLRKLLPSIGKNWTLIFLISMLVLFSIARKSFFDARTFTNILVSSVCALLLATGETPVIITGGIDLSIGFVRGLAAVLSALIMRDLYAAGYPPVVSILSGCSIGILVGLLPGLVNGILVAKLRVPPFIATLGMYGIANGVALKLCGGFPVTFLPPEVSKIGNGFIAYLLPGKSFTFFHKPSITESLELRNLIGIIPYSVVIALVLTGIFGFILAKTKFGQHTYAIGGSADAATRAGINVPSHLIKTYMVSSFFASCSGVLSVLIFNIGSHTQFSSSYELFAIAAVVIGGASLMGGTGSILGTIIGVLILSTLEIGFLMCGIMPFYRFIAVGCILILAVLIDQFFPELVHK